MKGKRFFLLLPALIPLALKAGYLRTAWRTSPLDRKDWIFVAAALLLALLRRKAIREWISKPDWKGLLPAGLSLLFFVFFAIKPIAALQIASAMFFFFSILWVLGGLRLFAGSLPLLGLSLLACPSTTYWSGFYLRAVLGTGAVDGFLFKLAAAAILTAFSLRAKQSLRPQTLAYLGTLGLLAVLLTVQTGQVPYGQPFRPDLRLLRAGDYIAAPIDPTPQDLRFFQGSRLVKNAYYGEDGELFYLLSVEVTDNVRKIHPTELCLKSGGSVIRKQREKNISIGDSKTLAVQEIEAVQPDGRKYLIYTWYTGPEWSTGNFIAFRKNWKPDESWQSFQLSTGITDTPESAEKRLNAFLEVLLNGFP
jgi:hypothetical protein